MVFSSTAFLFIFFPIVYLLYIVMPNIKAKNILLIVFSLLFYAFGEHKAILLMIFSIIINYILSLLIVKYEKYAKVFLIFGIVVDLGILCIFKYLGFILNTISNVFNISVPNVEIALPIGIYFFTFQALSYLIDVYKDKSLVQKNILNIILYISFFPQLIARPIIKYYDMEYQIYNRTISLDNTIKGLKRLIYGLSKKLLIANNIGIVVDNIFSMNNQDINILTAWIGGLSYALQIYFDFSGYSDMAIGLSKTFGFEFKKNFNYPYSSLSMKDFWNRWHISVSSWFKEYLYFSLGGNRKGALRTNINKIIVFFCTGLWHGANFTFILWGLIHGTLLMLEYYQIIPTNKIKNTFIKRIYVNVLEYKSVRNNEYLKVYGKVNTSQPTGDIVKVYALIETGNSNICVEAFPIYESNLLKSIDDDGNIINDTCDTGYIGYSFMIPTNLLQDNTCKISILSSDTTKNISSGILSEIVL